jgi:NADH:ubiquinone oxidoreductase subunit H
MHLPRKELSGIAGYNVEYSWMDFVPFLLGEYTNMILIKCGALHLTFIGLQPFLDFSKMWKKIEGQLKPLLKRITSLTPKGPRQPKWLFAVLGRVL